METAIRIREADEDDGELLLEFHERLYRSHRDAVVAPEDLPLIEYRDYPEILVDDLRALLRDRNAHLLLAESEGDAVGYITGRMDVEPRRVLPRRGVIEDWYVESHARGKGIGGMLLAALEKRFIEAGCQVIESATWAANLDARRTHEALGFREIRVIYRKRV
jgi:ribosomal protein S18 acetylase RimI-like enzyme